MFAVLICWGILAIASLFVGQLWLRGLSRDVFESRTDRLVVSIWLGLLSLGVALLFVAYITPIDARVAGAFGLASFTILILKHGSIRSLFQGARSMPKIAAASCAVILLALAYDSANRVSAYDTGLYHYQIVRWLASFGLVENVAMLHGRLGQNSPWFALGALMDHGVLQGRSAGILGGFAGALAGAHLLNLCARFSRGVLEPHTLFLASGYFASVCVALWWGLHRSLSVDWPSWIITLLVVWLMAQPRIQESDRWLALLVAAAGSALKFTLIPLAGVAALFFVGRNLSVKRLVLLSIALSLFWLPTVLANKTTSGCPAFPSSFYCTDSTSAAAASAESGRILMWARLGASTQDTAGFLGWLPIWLSHPDRLVILIANALSILALICFKSVRRRTTGSLWAITSAVTGIAIVMPLAPNPRLGLGYFLILPSLAVAGLVAGMNLGSKLEGWRTAKTEWIGPVFATLGLLVVAGLGVQSHAGVQIASAADDLLRCGHSQLLLPCPLPSEDGDPILVRNRRYNHVARLSLKESELNGIRYVHPVGGDQCWGARIPCTGDDPPTTLRYRNPSLGPGGGFSVGD